MPSGGSLVDITCNHPDLGVFSFDPYGSEDSTYMKGGVVSDDDDTAITGNNKIVNKQTLMRDSFSATAAGSPGDLTLENLQSLGGAINPGVWTFTNINGTIYKITGWIVGQMTANGMDSKIPFKVAGNNFQII